jgi:translocation protein SEC62
MRCVAAEQTFQEEFFYAWQYERETSPWLYFFSGLVVVVVIAACLFPLAPYWLRLTVVYAAMALLTLIFAIIIVRSIIALTTWVVAGRTLWLFPYLLADVPPPPSPA